MTASGQYVIYITFLLNKKSSCHEVRTFKESITCTRLHSDLLGESLPILTPIGTALGLNSQFRIWSMRRSAAVQTLTSGIAESDSTILFVTLNAASRAQQ